MAAITPAITPATTPPVSIPVIKIRSVEQIRAATAEEKQSHPNLAVGVSIPAGDAELRGKIVADYPSLIIFDEPSVAAAPNPSSGYGFAFGTFVLILGAVMLFKPSLFEILKLQPSSTYLVSSSLLTGGVCIFFAEIFFSSVPILPRYISIFFLCAGILVFLSLEDETSAEYVGGFLLVLGLAILLSYAATMENLDKWKNYLVRVVDFVKTCKELLLVAAVTPPIIYAVLGGLREAYRDQRMLRVHEPRINQRDGPMLPAA